MLTIRQLFTRTSKDRKQRAQYVRCLGMKTGYTKAGFGFVAAKSYSFYKVNSEGRLVRNLTPHKYLTMITFVNSKLQCHVSCSCEDNLYRWEFANANRGAAEIEYSNGDPPNTTNPEYKPALCKHLVALYLKIQPKLPTGT